MFLLENGHVLKQGVETAEERMGAGSFIPGRSNNNPIYFNSALHVQSTSTLMCSLNPPQNLEKETAQG